MKIKIEILVKKSANPAQIGYLKVIDKILDNVNLTLSNSGVSAKLRYNIDEQQKNEFTSFYLLEMNMNDNFTALEFAEFLQKTKERFISITMKQFSYISPEDLLFKQFELV